ncbi:MAG TPA: hypothetical protein VHY35_02235 [Stellaceae bacterium]|jgi:hypothetical protein|nr:hypothetical protein [Stellaceae bacterium]
MHISLANSRENGFKNWSDAQRPGNDDDNPGVATPIDHQPPAKDLDALQGPLERE